MKLNAMKLALTGGIYFGACYALCTLASLWGIPGFPPFTKLLVDFYGPWGYDVTYLGVLVGAIWGFVEGFIHLGIFGWLYNMMVGEKD